MKVWAPIFNLIAVLCIILLGATYLNIDYVLERDFDQFRYNYAVRQSTEAMFRVTLHAEDIGLDYTDMAYVTIDCADALETFDRVMCANYNMAPSEENFAAINETFVTCVIAGYDGYYILRSAEANSLPNHVAYDSNAPKFSAKLPYLLESNGNVYALDSYRKQYTWMSTTDPSDNPGLYTIGEIYPSGINKEDINTQINQSIRSQILREARNTSNVNIESFDSFRLFFPDVRTVTGVNPFEVPGIVVILDGAEYASTEALSSVAVSGFKVIKRNLVVGFTDTRTNRHYYCYEGQLKDIEKTMASGGVGTSGYFEIEDYYSTIEEACREESSAATPGDPCPYYVPYYDIMARKITEK